MLSLIQDALGTAKYLGANVRNMLQEYEDDYSVRDKLMEVGISLDHAKASQSEFYELLKYKVKGLAK